MPQILYVHGRGAVTDAADLIARHGAGAGYEAASRADRSRMIGNHIHFCRWRQVERLIDILSTDRVVGTVH